MTHEIRTPMNSMIGMIEVLETMDLAADKKHNWYYPKLCVFSAAHY
ncbi:MAG: histidine kinase dimerization/phospho-acceptor domain-containing protein [Rhodobacterales bacterium]|jgi:signal transduction histidine kinase